MIKKTYKTEDSFKEAIFALMDTGFSFSVDYDEKNNHMGPRETEYIVYVLESRHITKTNQKQNELMQNLKQYKKNIDTVEMQKLEVEERLNKLEADYENLQNEHAAYKDVYTRKEDPGEEEKADDEISLSIRIEGQPVMSIFMHKDFYKGLEESTEGDNVFVPVKFLGVFYKIIGLSRIDNAVMWDLKETGSERDYLNLDSFIKNNDIKKEIKM